MTETISFRYNSPENFTRLLCEIVYEQTHTPREISIYHKRFDNEADTFFYNMLVKLYPNGATIDEKAINECVKFIDNFLANDERAKDIKAEYEWANCDSGVYFDIDKKVYYCRSSSHQQTIKNICVDYFKGFDNRELSEEYVRHFILEHFRVKSYFSTVETIANDARYIRDCIFFGTQKARIK